MSTQQLAITGTKTSVETFSGLPCHRLTLACGDSLLVAQHGAHVLSWTVGGIEQLYLSPRAVMDGKAAIRGGVPVCFPQFNQRGSLPKHGFVRNLTWVADAVVDGFQQAEGIKADEGVCRFVLRLSASEATRALWPVEFTLSLTIDLRPGDLQLTLSFSNLDASPVDITGALHTYFAVDDIGTATVQGLQGQPEWDAVADVHGHAAQALHFHSEFDRVYGAASGPVVLKAGSRQLAITQSANWANTVVWNPGATLCANMADMPADGYRNMLCIEAAQVMQPSTVPPGGMWNGWQRLVSTIGAC